MKHFTALLLSFAGPVLVAGGSIAVGQPTGTLKEPPSTTVVVQGKSSLSETTHRVETAQSASTRQTVLTAKYKFNEKSARVKKLQRVVGVYIDGHYGKFTRQAHIAKLKAAGLSTALVPAVQLPPVRYNISYDKTHRCPSFEPMLEQHGLHPVDVFSYVAWRESRCSPSAINAIWKNGKIVWTLNKDGSYDSGLLQINSSWKQVTSDVCKTDYGDLKVLLVLDCNLQVAKFILDNSSSGLGNWRIYKRS